MIPNKIYYTLRPFIPRIAQIALRRQIVLFKRKRNSFRWPIDESAYRLPPKWEGWPKDKKFAFVLIHDVDTRQGLDRCENLMRLEEKIGMRSSFNFVPERYLNMPSIRKLLVSRGFEIGVHGLKHDGKLFRSKRIFMKRAKRINQYLRDWKTSGFSSPSMHHNLAWMPMLDIKHATSTFDTDPFEPCPEGVRTIFPFWVEGNDTNDGYVELPYTLPQDFTLFILMQESDTRIWKRKLDWIVENNGMALLNTHPDYMKFNGGKCKLDQYPAARYEEFLNYVKDKYENQYWQALPCQIASFWRKNYKHRYPLNFSINGNSCG
jgi:hypothetical protein